MPKTDQLHPLAVENAELKRQRDEARALLREIYRDKWADPRERDDTEFMEKIEAVVSPSYLRGESDE